MFEPGEYNIQGMFLVCEFNEDILTVVNRIPITNFKFTATDEYVIWDSVQHINTELPNFLKQNGFQCWLPAMQLMYNCNKETKTITICYYHGKRKEETPSLIKSRKDIYEMYGLTPESKEIFAD